MNERVFRQILATFLVPMLSGARLGRTIPVVRATKLILQPRVGTLQIMPWKHRAYRLEVLREQPFTVEEIRLVELLLTEIRIAQVAQHSPYMPDLMRAVQRGAVSKLICNQRLQSIVAQVVAFLEGLASETYEGRPVVTAIGFIPSAAGGPVSLSELFQEDFSRVLSNGYDRMYICDDQVRVGGVKPLSARVSSGLVPLRLGALARWASGARVVVALNRVGEVMLLADRQLKFAKRRGVWRYYPHETIIGQMSVGSPEVQRAVYESCLDVSFSRTGACVGVLASRGIREFRNISSRNDLLHSPTTTKSKLLAAVVDKPFQDLDRRIRQDLMSIDGATVLRHSGEVVTAGAIIRVPGGSLSGGRRAAAKELSRFGMGIKVSSDGPVVGFARGHPSFEI